MCIFDANLRDSGQVCKHYLTIFWVGLGIPSASWRPGNGSDRRFPRPPGTTRCASKFRKPSALSPEPETHSPAQTRLPSRGFRRRTGLWRTSRQGRAGWPRRVSSAEIVQTPAPGGVPRCRAALKSVILRVRTSHPEVFKFISGLMFLARPRPARVARGPCNEYESNQRLVLRQDRHEVARSVAV